MKSGLISNITQSIYNVVQHKLLEAGAYFNVVKGQTDAQGNNISLLKKSIDQNLFNSQGYVWQSNFKNFVYESGVKNQPPPIVISGVYVNDVFQPKSDTCIVDHHNGRVIFPNGINVNSKVEANFAYPECALIRDDPTNQLKDQDQPDPNGTIYVEGAIHSPYYTYLPAVFLQVLAGGEKGFELGGMNASEPIISFSILSEDKEQVDNVGDVIQSLGSKGFPVVDVIEGPKFNSWGDLTEPYDFYLWCPKKVSYGFVKSVRFNRFDTRLEQGRPRIYAGVVNLELSVLRP